MTMQLQSTKVLYITGSPRSGSTILSKTLGQIPGFFHAGELRFLWDKNFQDGFPCECGNLLRDCEIWSKVFQAAYGGVDLIDPAEMLEYREKHIRTKHMPYMLTNYGRQRLLADLKPYFVNLDRLYSSIRETTGCDVIIDSSKFPSYGYILSMLPSVDIFYLHLIRDSRAVAYSRLKKKKWDETGIYMARYNPLRSSLQWSALNISSELLKVKFPDNYLKLRYEDFIRFPRETIETITSKVGLKFTDLSFLKSNHINVHKTHTNWGNPIRNDVGTIDLLIDDEWKADLSGSSKALVSTLTTPLLLRYRYL